MEKIQAKTLLTKFKKNNFWFDMDYNMNLYRGCVFGCIYCDSRSECYRNDDFENVLIKENALILLDSYLKNKVPGVVGIGAMSDTYNPYEKQEELTRSALKIIEHYGFGVGIATKSDLILRDIDILKKINEKSSIIIKVTITSADEDITKRIEPNAPTSARRFEVVKTLRDNNIFAGILLMPVLPFINDTVENVKQIVKMAHAANANFIYAYFGVTLRDRQRDFFYDKLTKHFPNMKSKYQRRYQNQYSCSSDKSEMLYKIFVEECRKYNILYKIADINRAFKKKNQVPVQLALDL